MNRNHNCVLRHYKDNKESGEDLSKPSQKLWIPSGPQDQGSIEIQIRQLNFCYITILSGNLITILCRSQGKQLLAQGKLYKLVVGDTLKFKYPPNTSGIPDDKDDEHTNSINEYLKLESLQPEVTINYLLNFLPAIYHKENFAEVESSLVCRLLEIIEQTLLPVMDSVNHASLYFDPVTSPHTVYFWLRKYFSLGLTYEGLQHILQSTGLQELKVSPNAPGSFKVTVDMENNKFEQQKPLIESVIKRFKPVGVDYEIVNTSQKMS